MSRRFSFGATKWPGVAKLVEECGEVVQVAGKLMNLEGDSAEHWDGTNLRDEIMKEMADVLAAIAFVTTHCKLDERAIRQRVVGKLALFEQWHIEQGEGRRNTRIVAKDPKRGFLQEGGLGAHGVGQMWRRTFNADRLTAEYVNATLRDSTGDFGAEKDALPDATCHTCGVVIEPGPSMLHYERYVCRVCGTCEMSNKESH